MQRFIGSRRVVIAPILAVSLLAARAGVAAPPAGPLDPLGALETEVSADLGSALATLEGGPERAAIKARVEDDYRSLHDLRNRAAFSALWRGLSWRRSPLRVLYVASGSHLAPLTILFSGPPLKNAEFVFTEIDPAVPGRIRALLRRLRPWGVRVVTERSSGPETAFTFTCRGTRSILRIVLASEAGAVPFTPEELERADVVITHDWAGDQHDNLALLFAIVRSACASHRRRPLAVFMEDLEAHPFPIDLSLFHPVVHAPLPYGHLDHVRLPDGSRLKAEDGIALYGGAVALVPDWSALGALRPEQLETVFDVLLFSDALFDRLNVDLVRGRLVTAPPLLDLATGYGYRTIQGKDVRGSGDFPLQLLRAALDLLPALPATLRAAWCLRLDAFGRALRGAENADFGAVVRESEAHLDDHPFLSTEQERDVLKEAYAHRDDYVRMKNQEKTAVRSARDAYDRAAEALRASCGGTAASPTAPK